MPCRQTHHKHESGEKKKDKRENVVSNVRPGDASAFISTPDATPQNIQSQRAPRSGCFLPGGRDEVKPGLMGLKKLELK
ncbi:hypothetical protein EYF80_030422 [Liparis tanakae]|uniref:Uncharacterized protein n=1 Tax=Liparis tanakae TaxID=230148 RepID=A0A4Z2H0L8_9TELE|nr:hypothetical protein EYF80_030422 [Liparis tanakae]